MTNNIFNKEFDNIFYIKIKGEVYEMKFENLVIQMNTIRGEYGTTNITEQSIVTIRVMIASLGSGLWYSTEYGHTLPVRQIYNTLEDCVKDENPLFDYGKYGNLNFQKAVGNMIVDIDDVTPKCGYWKESHTFRGEPIYQLHTYRWNGTEVVDEIMKSPNTEETKDLVFHNSYETVHYDLVTESFVIDSEFAKTHYASREECAKGNIVIVHRF